MFSDKALSQFQLGALVGNRKILEILDKKFQIFSGNDFG